MSIILITGIRFQFYLFEMLVNMKRAASQTSTAAPSFSVMPPFAHDVRLHKNDVRLHRNFCIHFRWDNTPHGFW